MVRGSKAQALSVSVSAGTVAKVILVLVLFYFLYQVRDVLLVVLTAVVIASAIEPLTLWFIEKRVRRLPAVLLIYLLLGIVFIAVLFFFLPLLLDEVGSYLSNLPKYLDYAKLWFPTESQSILEGSEAVRGFSSGFSLKESLSDFSSTLNTASEGFVRVVSLVFGGFVSFLLILILSFYLAVQDDGIASFLRIITPARHESYVIDLWRRTQRKIGYWMQGQLLLAVIVGVLVYLGLTILGVSQALTLAVIASVFELIPVFGPILSSIPAILIGVSDSGLAFGVIIAGLYLIIQQFENHLIYPLVVKKIVGVSPIVVILALIVGVKLAGFLGLILSVPVAAALMEYLSDIEKNKVLARTNGGG